MIKFEKTDVVGLEHAIRGMRNPHNSWDRMDSHVCTVESVAECVECEHLLKKDGEFSLCTQPFKVGTNDLELMTKLSAGGPVHAKYRRMIVVYVDITAPLYWWKEFDTYKVGTVANSCSTMHKIHEKEFTLEDFSCEHLCDKHNDIDVMGELCDELGYFTSSPMDDLIGDIKKLNAYRTLYLKCDAKLKREDLTDSERKHVISQRKLWWWQMIQRLGSNYNQKRTIMLSYEVLANIYEFRKTHKLDEWRYLCKWIEDLPYSELITRSTSLENKKNGWRPISEYDKSKYDWVLVKMFDGDFECVPIVAEMSRDGKWYSRDDIELPFKVRYFFDMQQIGGV